MCTTGKVRERINILILTGNSLFSNFYMIIFYQVNEKEISYQGLYPQMIHQSPYIGITFDSLNVDKIIMDCMFPISSISANVFKINC